MNTSKIIKGLMVVGVLVSGQVFAVGDKNNQTVFGQVGDVVTAGVTGSAKVAWWTVDKTADFFEKYCYCAFGSVIGAFGIQVFCGALGSFTHAIGLRQVGHFLIKNQNFIDSSSLIEKFVDEWPSTIGSYFEPLYETGLGHVLLGSFLGLVMMNSACKFYKRCLPE